MKVTPIAFEPTRFRVESESGEPDYLVDVEEFKWNGCCDCIGFMGHFWVPMWDAKDRGIVMNERMRCKHIRAALVEYNRTNKTNIE